MLKSCSDGSSGPDRRDEDLPVMILLPPPTNGNERRNGILDVVSGGSSGPPEYDLTRTGCDARVDDRPLEEGWVCRFFHEDKGLGVPFS